MSCRRNLSLSTLFAAAVLLGACSGTSDGQTTPPGPEAAASAPVTPFSDLVALALDDTYAYDKLEDLCDTVGPRLAGTAGMQRAVDWSIRSLQDAGFDSVWTEAVTVPHWRRGREWARCVAPYACELEMTGLGLSVGTGPEHPDGLEAEVLAVRDFDELEARAAEVTGKIVVFYPDWEGYGRTVQYRVHGASRAAAHGAVACLVRSATGVSLGAAHTGMMVYAEDQPRIPTAALSVEDAARLYRMCRRGLRPRVRLYMEAENLGETTCHNVLAQVDGSEQPEEIVLLGGHLDSWDVGPCAQDDGAGVTLTMAAARLLADPTHRPRRSVRLVLFTTEELGGYGGRAYLAAHEHELDRHVLALESDAGAYFPLGFSVQADSTVVDRIAGLAAPLAPLGDERWRVQAGGSGVDIGPIVQRGVPGVGHRVDTEHYFDVHHSRADTFEKVDAHLMARNTAVIVGLIQAVADLPGPLIPGR